MRIYTSTTNPINKDDRHIQEVHSFSYHTDWRVFIDGLCTNWVPWAHVGIMTFWAPGLNEYKDAFLPVIIPTGHEILLFPIDELYILDTKIGILC